MGGLAVLHPQDCLIDRHQTFINSHMKPRRNPNPNSNANPTRSNRRKRSPETSGNNKSRHTVADNFPAKNLVMGQVKILKRREELTVLKNLGPGVDEKKPKKTGDLGSTRSGVYEKKPKKEAGDLVLSTTAQDPTEPEMMPKQMRLGDFYAGSAIIASPPPSSLPLPAFFAKRSVLSNNEDATTDLRRLLRLSLV